MLRTTSTYQIDNFFGAKSYKILKPSESQKLDKKVNFCIDVHAQFKGSHFGVHVYYHQRLTTCRELPPTKETTHQN